MLRDMKRDMEDDDAGEAAMPMMESEGQYPYGLCICLDKEELDKLGITTLPKIGAEFKGEFVACVTRLSEIAETGTNGGTDRSMSVQIKMLDMVQEVEQPGATNTVKAERRESTTLLGSY